MSSTTSIKDIYLILFNNACTTGWGMLWCMSVYAIITNVNNIKGINITPSLLLSTISDALRSVYHSNELFSSVLVMSQCMALFEILHALIGIVKSPIHVTTMQVTSRIVALVAIYYSPNAQSKFSFLPMFDSFLFGCLP